MDGREFVDSKLEFHLSNVNGIALQRELGLDPDYCGAISREQIDKIIDQYLEEPPRKMSYREILFLALASVAQELDLGIGFG